MYHTCLVDCISFTIHRNEELLDSTERETLSSILEFHDSKQGIEHGAVTLLSRMFIRRNDWMKSTSFKDYLHNYSKGNVYPVEIVDKNESAEQVCSRWRHFRYCSLIQSAYVCSICVFQSRIRSIRNLNNIFSFIQAKLYDVLQFLRINKYVDLIDPNVDMKKAVVHQDEQDALSFELLWSAVEGSFTLEELADLHYSVTSAKCPGQGKAHLLSVIKKVVSTQRDIFGIALKDNFYKLMTKALRRKAKDPSMIVRLKPHIYSLLRRIQRLYQVHLHSPIRIYSYLNSSIHVYLVDILHGDHW